MRALITCVGMDDFLAVTLPYNRHHFEEVLVLVGPEDDAAVAIARECQAKVLATDIFFCGPGPFNKYAGIEQGLDAMGRHGWIAIMDCDVLMPKVAYGLDMVMPGHLYGARRRMWTSYPHNPLPIRYTDELLVHRLPSSDHWSEFPLHWLHSHRRWHKHLSGYLQVFHADDPHLGSPPWHRLDLPGAGAGDTYFQDKWPEENRLWLPFDVLHIGPSDRKNWRGRATPRIVGGQGETPAPPCPRR